MKRVIESLVILCGSLAPVAFAAESYPVKPIRFIVPFPPGGGTDAFARILSPKLTELLGQQIIVDNRAGAQGNIGTAAAAKSPPDGYTILLAHQGALTINPHLYGNTGYDTLRDFVAVARGTATAMVLVAHPALPAKTMKELAALAKQNPGKLTFASTASGQQLAGELFKLTTKTDLLHVPYKGAGPAVIDLLAGSHRAHECSRSDDLSQRPRRIREADTRRLRALGQSREGIGREGGVITRSDAKK